MTTASATETVWMRELLRDRRFQVRKALDPQTVNRYAAVFSSGRAMPPIKVARIKGVAFVVDGWHRLAALEKLGRYEVEAEVVEATEREALWLAAQANLGHGLPLKSGEIRAAFRAYVKARQHVRSNGSLKSFRDIAQELGGLRQHTTVRNWMMHDFPRTAAAMGGAEDFKGTGGPRETTAVDPYYIALRALHEAVAASKGITAPETRWELIERAKEVVQELETGGPVEEPEF